MTAFDRNFVLIMAFIENHLRTKADINLMILYLRNFGFVAFLDELCQDNTVFKLRF